MVSTSCPSDPDGIDDLIGGTLNDAATGRAYGSVATAASEGSYSLTLTWADLNSVVPANEFPRGFVEHFQVTSAPVAPAHPCGTADGQDAARR